MIQRGCKLVCIDDVFPAWAKVLYTEFPVKGRIYTLREFNIGVDVQNVGQNDDSSLLFTGNKNYTVWLEEIINPVMPTSQKEMGFKAERFAPVETISQEDEEEISQPVRGSVPQPRELELV